MPSNVTQTYIFLFTNKHYRERGRKGISATWRASKNATSKRPSKLATNAKKKRAAIQPSPHRS